ncbi:MAG: exodeoxyribonuclease VII large subunit, partial [Anaerolineales bacterium]
SSIIRAMTLGGEGGFRGTFDLYPQEGKYHYDGHRKCGVCMDPVETLKNGGLCPICGKKVTVGVVNRIAELSDRENILDRPGRLPFNSLIPLKEILSEIYSVGVGSKKIAAEYEKLIDRLGSEFSILFDCPVEDLARGGGSLEDLWAFNDERVARAIVSSQAPVISGVGHETDFTIADFAADLRAPTPTAAAELATPNQDDLRALLSEDLTHMRRSIESLLSGYRWELDVQRNRLRLYSPVPQIRTDRQRLDDLTRRAGAALTHRIKLQRARLSGLNQRLSALNPLAVLERGYSIVTQPDGRLVRRVHQVKPGEDLNVRVSDGDFGVQVKEKGPSKK